MHMVIEMCNTCSWLYLQVLLLVPMGPRVHLLYLQKQVGTDIRSWVGPVNLKPPRILKLFIALL